MKQKISIKTHRGDKLHYPAAACSSLALTFLLSISSAVVADTFNQSSWSGGVPIDAAACSAAGGAWISGALCRAKAPANEMGWHVYNSADNDVIATDALTLVSGASSLTHTSTADFSMPGSALLNSSNASDKVSLDIIASEVGWAATDSWTYTISTGPVDDNPRRSKIGVGDFNLDGFPDFISADDFAFSVNHANPGQRGAYRHTGVSPMSWIYHQEWNLPNDLTAQQPAYAEVGDLDGDGDLDALIGIKTHNKIYAHINSGGAGNRPTWSRDSSWDINYAALGGVGSSPNASLGDLDGDGDLDAMVAAEGNVGRVFGFRNDGAGGWEIMPAWEATIANRWNLYFANVSLADFDGDGDFDLLIGEEGTDHEAYENRGGPLQPNWVRNNAWDVQNPPSYTRFETTDLNGDGKVDLIISDSGAVLHGRENLLSNTYAASGSYTSPVLDFATHVYTTLSYSAVVPATAGLAIEVRGGSDPSTAHQSWTGWQSVSNSGDNIYGLTNGQRYVQYRAVLNATADGLATPELLEVIIYQAGVPLLSALISSPYDSSMIAGHIDQLGWSQQLASGSDVRVQLRSAVDVAGEPGGWSDWVGPDGTIGSYWNSANTHSGGCSGATTVSCSIIPSVLADTSDGQWFQYQFILVSDGIGLPQVSDISIDYSAGLPPGITVAPTSGLVTTESLGQATFTVALDTLPSSNVTIALSSSDASEGTVSPASLLFTSSNGTDVQTVTVTGVDDGVVDGNIDYSIVTVAAVSSDSNYNNLNPADVSVTNTDNDTLGVTVTPNVGLTTTEAGGQASFSVSLNTLPSANVTISLSSSYEAEGSLSHTSLTFTPATGTDPQLVTITGVDDFIDDGDVTYSIITGNTVSSDSNYSALVVDDVAVTNRDNDTLGFTITPTAGLTTNESGSSALISVALNTQPTADVTLALSSSDTTEGIVSSASITIPVATWQVPRTVVVTGVDDDVVDGAVAYSVVTAAATSSDSDYNNLNPVDVSVTNIDNDIVGVSISPTFGLLTTEASGSATFSIVLIGAPEANVEIPLVSSDPTEGSLSLSSVIFTTSNWNTPQIVTVVGIGDSIIDGPIVYQIETGAAISDDAAYSGVNPSDVSLTNIDNDGIGNVTLSRTGGLVTSEAGDSETFSVVLDLQPTDEVRLPLYASDSTEGVVSPSLLIFTPLNWDQPQMVTVTGRDDITVDGHVHFNVVTAEIESLDANYRGMNPVDVAVTNTDDDHAGIEVSKLAGLVTTEAGGGDSFTFNLKTLPTALVTVRLASSDGSEGVVSPSSFEFHAGNWSVPQTAMVSGVDDSHFDGDMAYTIEVVAETGSDPVYNSIVAASVFAINVDNDLAGAFDKAFVQSDWSEGPLTFQAACENSHGVWKVVECVATAPVNQGGWQSFSGSDDGIANGSTLTLANNASAFHHSSNSDFGVPAANITTAAGELRLTRQSFAWGGWVANSDYSFTMPSGTSPSPALGDLNGDGLLDLFSGVRWGGGDDLPVMRNSGMPGAGLWVDEPSWRPDNREISPRDTGWWHSSLVDINGDGKLDLYLFVLFTNYTQAGGYENVGTVDAPVWARRVAWDLLPTGDGNARIYDADFSDLDGDGDFDVMVGQFNGNLRAYENIGSKTQAIWDWNPAWTPPRVNWSAAPALADLDGDGDADLLIGVNTGVVQAYENVGIDTANPWSRNATWDPAAVGSLPAFGDLDHDGHQDLLIGSRGDATLAPALINGSSATYAASGQYLSAVSDLGVHLGFTTLDYSARIPVGASVVVDVRGGDTVNAGDDSWTPWQNGLNAGADISSALGTKRYVQYRVTLNASADNAQTPALRDITFNYNGLNSGAQLTSTPFDSGETNSCISRLMWNESLANGTDIQFQLRTASDSGGVPGAWSRWLGPDGSTASYWNSNNTFDGGCLGDGAISCTKIPSLLRNGSGNQWVQYRTTLMATEGVTPLLSEVQLLYSGGSFAGGVNVSPTSGISTSESGGQAFFTVGLERQPSADVLIELSSSDVSEAQVSPSLLTFTPANWSAQTVTVTGLGDLLADGNVAYTIITSATKSNDASFNNLVVADVAATNLNVGGGAGSVTVTPVTGLITTELGGNAQFTVVLDSAPSADVSISLASSDTTEGTVSPATLTFSSSNWSSPQTATVSGVNDNADDDSVVYTILTSETSSTDSSFDGVEVSDVSLLNSDDDTLTFDFIARGGTTTSEGGGFAVFELKLRSQPTANVTVTLMSSDYTEGGVTPSRMIFTDSDWDEPHLGTAVGWNDHEHDGDQQYQIITMPMISSDPSFAFVDPEDFTFTNLDNESSFTPPPAPELPTVTVATGVATISEGSADSAYFNVTRSESTADPLTVYYSVGGSATNGIDYESIGGVMTIPAGNSLATISLTPLNDSIYEGDENVIITLSTDADYLVGGASPAIATIVEDELASAPLVNFVLDQLVAEGMMVSVTAELSQPASTYPVTIPYSVSGSALNPDDHDAADGVIVITAGTRGSVSFSTARDFASEEDEVVTFNMGLPTNANTMPGGRVMHTVTITENNVAPLASLTAEQSGVDTQLTVQGNGVVRITASASDVNPDDVLSYDWVMTNNNLVDIYDADPTTFQFNPSLIGAGFYAVRVTVSDNGVPQLSSAVELLLEVRSTAPLLSGSDSDGDGVPDNNESYQDSDGDGIPDYLDASTLAANELQVIPTDAVSYLMRTDVGLTLALGETAFAAGSDGAQIDAAEIASYGGGEGAPGSADANDTVPNTGGYFDFVIQGLSQVGQSVRVVLPQMAAIPANSVYRKYDPVDGWRNFAQDSKNAVASAPGLPGLCPLPGDMAYTAGLTAGHYCMQLTIEDGGPNDADGTANYVIEDPGQIGQSPLAIDDSPSDGADSGASASESGGGANGLLWLLVQLVMLGGLWRIRYRAGC